MREMGVSGRPRRAVMSGVVALIAAVLLWVATSDRPGTTPHAVSAPERLAGSNAAVVDHAPVTAVHA
ncbi:MAG TPA: hypothetical protein VK509_20415, partial [Polyangiales bacterium]|nr:hypothetical protein [Polyangiales bacterium]